MAWSIKFDRAAAKELAKLDKTVAKRITRFLAERVAPLDNPREIGSPLKGSALGEFWRYRVGDYRIVCRIEGAGITVIVLRVASRKEVYR